MFHVQIYYTGTCTNVFGYQPVPELVHTPHKLKHRNRILAKYEKIEKAVESELVCLDDEVNRYIEDTIESPQCLTTLPGSSFQCICWMQQVEAAKKKRGMHWHPLMICWCSYLRHRKNKKIKLLGIHVYIVPADLSGTCEALRNSGCIVLPSQHTLRDYTHYFKHLGEFSVEVYV